MPHFGATFYPGVDDYYMPEVVAPSPQRVMPEVPQNMQQGLQRMELEARTIDPRNASAQGTARSGPQHTREPSLSTVLKTRADSFGQQYRQGTQQSGGYSPASNFSPFHETQDSRQQSNKNVPDMRDLPSFSPFPKVQGEHIPPSDEEKEAVLAESREHVLHSNDPNMQICWARDVLAYVETSAEAALREADALRGPNDRELVSRPPTPKIEHELRVDATNIVSYLAEQGHPEALFIQGKWLEFGKFGRRQDKKEAYSGYMAAAQQGWGRADYRIGMLYENSNDMDKAMRHYNSGLAANDSAASYRLGMINLMGQRGLPKNITKGLDLIQQAADTADEDAPQGAFVYGMIVARDLPDVAIPDGALTSDLSVARQYIEKAAYLGFAKAQLKMGQAYELCQLECDFNPALSLHYYGLASRQGQPEASLGVSRWFLFGYEGTFAKNEQLAFGYALLAAKAKLPTGEFAMGYYNEIGISVEKDLREARRWYELAAEHGNKDAVGRLEGLSQAKTLSKKDHETTALTRIKSKHGSQRGQRPERFKQVNASMPTVTEDYSPKVSPHPSPRTATFDHADMPDPSRPGAMAKNGRSPAFGVNLASRSQSAVPYPEDSRPPPLNLGGGRSASSTPYPEDDMPTKPQLSPHYNPNIRPSGAPGAGGAFGIRTQSPGRAGPPGGAIRPSHSAGQLPVPAGVDPNRGRPVSAGWQPHGPAGYPQGGPGPRGHYDQRPPSGYDSRLAGANRMPKPGPGAGGYGPRESSMSSSRPSTGSGPGPHDPYGNRPSSGPGSPIMAGGLGPRTNTMTPQGLPQGGPGGQRMPSGGGPGVALKDRPMPMDDPGRASAPPQSRPGMPSPTPSIGTSASAPAKPGKSGPATFEQMGIPQGKQDDQCVVM